MTQFIEVTVQTLATKIRLNVDEIQTYHRGPREVATKVLLRNGRSLVVSEDLTQINNMIKNSDDGSIVSAT